MAEELLVNLEGFDGTNSLTLNFNQDTKLNGVLLSDIVIEDKIDFLLEAFVLDPERYPETDLRSMMDETKLLFNLTSSSIQMTLEDGALTKEAFEQLDTEGAGNGIYRMDIGVDETSYTDIDNQQLSTDVEDFKIEFTVGEDVDGNPDYTQDPVAEFITLQQWEDRRVAEVEDAISSLPATEELTLEDRGIVEEVRLLYDELPSDLQGQVTNYQVLLDAEAKIADLEDQEAITSVEDAINAIPADVTIEDKQLVEDARTEYDALDTSLQSEVTNYQTLVDAEDEIANLEAIASVEDSINAIPTEVTLDDKQVIEGARADYDALDEVLQSEVTNYQVLLDAEGEIASMEQEIQDVEDAIDLIPLEVTLQDKQVVEDARAQYDLLDVSLQSEVSNYQVLLDAETEIDNLESVASVEDAIDAIPLEVTLEDKPTVEAARTEYDALDVSLQSEVTNYQTLLDAEDEIAYLESLRTVTFEVGLEGALITIGEETKLTDSLGNAEFELVEGTGYEYSISKEGFHTKTGTFDLINDKTISVTLEEILYEVTFETGVSGVSISIGEETKTTDETGVAKFQLDGDSTYTYTAEKEGYHTKETSFDLVDTDKVVAISMEKILYDVSFLVDDGIDPIENVEVTIDGETKLTDEFGYATFELVGNEDYLYTVSKDFFEVKEGTVSVLESNKEIQLSLATLKSEVQFSVSYLEEPVANAIVEIDGIEKQTNNDGIVLFELDSGQEFNYTISKDSYNTESGTLFTNSDQLQIDQELEKLLYGDEGSFTTKAVVGSILAKLADMVEDTKARLHGELEDLGDLDEAQVFFEYSTDKDFVEDLNTTEKLTVLAPQEFSEDITGLTSNAVYYFRAVVEYEDQGDIQRTESERRYFSTAPSIPVIVSRPISNLGQFDAVLRAELETLGDFNSVKVFFEYSKYEDFSEIKTTDVKMLETPQVIEENVVELESSTQYFYRPVVVKSHTQIELASKE